VAVDVVLYTLPVFTDLAVIVAFATAAPELSKMEPAIEPRFDWAHTGLLMEIKINRNAKTKCRSAKTATERIA
jgi:hypothetical protein